MKHCWNRLFFIVSLTIPLYNWKGGEGGEGDMFSTCQKEAYWQGHLYIPWKMLLGIFISVESFSIFFYLGGGAGGSK